MSRKGIILAGGTGTRLHPLTYAVSKQLMPVYDKPLIYYPLATLMIAGIRDLLVITTPDDQSAFYKLLGDGSQWGLTINYANQPNPDGIAQALVIAKEFLAGAPAALVLGDNIFFGHGLADTLQHAMDNDGASIFAYRVNDPQRYGIAVFDKKGALSDIVEKPKEYLSDYAITGLYFYDADAPNMAAALKPSARGELEITDLNKAYLAAGKLSVAKLGRGTAWLDTGTHESLMAAAEFVRVVEDRQGLKVCCPEEIAWRLDYIDDRCLMALAAPLMQNSYGRYLERLVKHCKD